MTKRIAISGSWRTVDAVVESDVRQCVREICGRGDSVVTGGALGVDFIATDEVLKITPVHPAILIYLPTPLVVFYAHFRARAAEGVITPDTAETLIHQIDQVHRANPAAIIEGPFDRCNPETYHTRNGWIIDAANELCAFHVNESEGVQDAVDKAHARGIPVRHYRYTIPAR